MVFLKRQVENKNGNEYENFYFYHGNTYLGKAEDGLSSIQANIKDELGETVNPEKIEKLQEEAREKMETEVKDESEDDLDLDINLDHWSRAKKRENKDHVAVWEFGNDRDVTVEIIEQDDGQEGKYYDVLEKVGGYTEHEIATAVMDVEKAIEEAERAMRTANENKTEMADSGYAYEKFEPDVSEEMREEAQDVSVKNWEWVDPESAVMVDEQEVPLAKWEHVDDSSESVLITTYTKSAGAEAGDGREQVFNTVIDVDVPGEVSRRQYKSFSSALNRAESWMEEHEPGNFEGFSDHKSEYEMSDSGKMIASGEDLEQMVRNHPSILEEQWDIEASGNTVEVSHKDADVSATLEIIERTDRHDETFYEYAIVGNLVEEYSPDVDIINLTTKKYSWLDLEYVIGDLTYLMSQAEEDYESNTSSVKNELSDIEAKPPEIGDEFYHVRVRDPSRYETERVPDWASDIADSVSKGSKVKMGKLGQGDWEVQSVMIKKSNVDRKKAKDLAERIAKKIDNSDGDMSDSGINVIDEIQDMGFFAYSGADGDLFRKQGLGGWRVRIYPWSYSIQKKSTMGRTSWNTKYRVESDSDEAGFGDKIESEQKKKDFLEQVERLVDEGDNYQAPEDYELSDSGSEGLISRVKDSVKNISSRSKMSDSGISKGDMVSWGDSNEDRYGVVVSVKSDGCFDEKIDGDVEVCASDDERAVLIESMSEDSRGKMVAHKEGTLRKVSKSELKDSGVELDPERFIFQGDEFQDRIANSELIYQDWDEDDVSNIDDREPLDPGNPESQRVNDEILLSEELQNLEELSENHRAVAKKLDQDLNIDKGRVKQPESIFKKLHEKYTEEVTDIVGVTVKTDSKEEVMEVADQLKSDYDLYPIGEERADENHYEEDGFYRAYHLIIEVEHEGEKYPAEVQIKTEEQAKLHGLAHEYYKKNEPMPDLLEEKARQLENGEIDSVDVDELKKKLP